MKIDGRALARDILDSLKNEVAELATHGVTPTLAVILVGDDPASVSYIKQKQHAAETIEANIRIKYLAASIKENELLTLITSLNTDPNIHGIIIQRPLPKKTNIDPMVLNTVVSRKDVDGFVPGSPFVAPVALAVTKILERIFTYEGEKQDGFRIKSGMTGFTAWLQDKTIVVVGRGETAGKPIAEYLAKAPRPGLGASITVIHSKTPHPEEILKTADIIVSCTGKQGIITKNVIKTDAVLIGVGIGRDGDHKLQGDYNEAEIEGLASYYTPTPGGVGPVNVACLMANLVTAAKTL